VVNVDRPFGGDWDMKMEISQFCAIPVIGRDLLIQQYLVTTSDLVSYYFIFGEIFGPLNFSVGLVLLKNQRREFITWFCCY
jgi:hypothetical protein